LGVQPAKLVFELGDAAVEAFQGLARLGGDSHAILAMMARGGATLGGIIKFLAAGAAGALALAGVQRRGKKNSDDFCMNKKAEGCGN